MPLSRNARAVTVVALATTLAFAPATQARQASARAAPKCTGGSVNIARGVSVVEAWRAYKGTDGLSHIEKVSIPGKKGVYYGGKVTVTVFDLGNPSRASFVYGEPNMVIPVHPVPYRETFIILSGSSEVHAAGGQVVKLGPGSMLTSDDLGTPGRGGTSGPCGYVALSLAYKDEMTTPK
jgi:mannose-6-phosphate isomerase-like protein (cupin superfamily)